MLPYLHPFQTVLLLIAALLSAPASAGERSPQANYILRCAGCHSLDGSGHIPGGIPPFPGFIDSFVNDDQGRTYLMHVPGVVASSLSDSEIAAVLNYVMQRWGATPDFQAFTRNEVTRRRALLVTDVVDYRRAVVQRLSAQGLPIADYPWP